MSSVRICAKCGTLHVEEVYDTEDLQAVLGRTSNLPFHQIIKKTTPCPCAGEK